jgi:hypothetical protein
MNSRENNTAGLSEVSVPAMVAAGLGRCQVERKRIAELTQQSHMGWAVRAERMAALCERESRWWTVLERWTYLAQCDVPRVFGRAAMQASDHWARRAEFWRGLASDWRRRAAGESVCEVIGCGCAGSAGCGVTA